MLTNQIYHSQQQLAPYHPHILSPNQIKMEANREDYTQINRELSLMLHTANSFGFDQNNNSDENSRIVDDMLLYKSYYAANNKLDTCLAIDCSVAHSQLTPACLSSSSSTTSTSSSSTSINMNENDTSKTPAQQHLKNYHLKKNNFLFKNVNKNFGSNINSPCASSSSECLSSDEGYVGSYSENYEFNKKRHIQLQNQHQRLILYLFNNGLLYPNSDQSLDENVHIEIPALFLVKDEQESVSNLLKLEDNFSICEKVYPKLEQNNLTKIRIFDDLNSSFNLESDNEIEQLSFRVMSEKLDEQKSDESEMSSSNWRKIVEKRQQNEIKTREFILEDECDLKAYLNEIDMNIDYSQFDQAYLNSKINSYDVDQYLKFSNNKMAFNLREYYQDLHNEKLSKKSSLFANLHVDSIPEFVPLIDSDFAYEDNSYEIDSNEYDINENNVINDEAEYTVIEGDYVDDKTEAFNYFDTTVTQNEFDDAESTPALEYEYQNTEEYEDYDDQIYIDSLTEEEAIALLRNESEIYALQMAQASKYGLLGESSTKNRKKSNKNKSRFNSGHTDDLSKTDIFENVFNYEENLDDDHFEYTDDIYIDDGYAPNSNISQSLRNSLLKLRKSRRHLTKLLNLNSQKASSNGSSTPSSTTSSLTTSNIGLYKQHIANQSKKPCMYMLAEGRCLRSDCRFVHDLKTITCKYWLEGECLKGENCEFLHEIVETEVGKSHNKNSSFKSKKEAKAKKDFKLDTEEFPALGLSNDKPKQSSPKNKPVSLANVVKKSAQKKESAKQLDEKKEEKKSKKSEHKARAGKNPSSTTPVIQITIKPNKSGKAKPSSCGSSVTSSGSSSTTSSRANSKIRGKK